MKCPSTQKTWVRTESLVKTNLEIAQAPKITVTGSHGGGAQGREALWTAELGKSLTSTFLKNTPCLS